MELTGVKMRYPRDYRRRNCLYLALITVALFFMYGRQREAKESAGAAMKGGSTAATKPRVKEKFEILPIKIPFLQTKGEWMQPDKGISMCSNGEPKSGTTWTEGVITELAVRLCGSPLNSWCRMGGLVVEPHHPAPNYMWEMVNADTGELFMHFNGRSKHEIVGLGIEDCNPRGKQHRNEFDTRFPCKAAVKENTRETIMECLPDTSERCAQLMPSRDPSVLRISVVFRDPREVVISEHRMRIDYYKKMDTSELNPFIYERFEQLVSWQYYRWMWHTTYYKDASHVVIYEDIKSKPEALADLASFMGLKSSPELMKEVLDNQQNGSPHGDYSSYGLPLETLEYMNATMSKLLPERLLDRYGLSPSSV